VLSKPGFNFCWYPSYWWQEEGHLAISALFLFSFFADYNLPHICIFATLFGIYCSGVLVMQISVLGVNRLEVFCLGSLCLGLMSRKVYVLESFCPLVFSMRKMAAVHYRLHLIA